MLNHKPSTMFEQAPSPKPVKVHKAENVNIWDKLFSNNDTRALKSSKRFTKTNNSNRIMRVFSADARND